MRILPCAQIIVAILIFANFLTNAFEAQVNHDLRNPDGSPSDTAAVLAKLDLIFTMIFTLELLVNMYAHLLYDFVTDGWSLFDFVVVMASIVSALSSSGGSAISVFRLMRAFRVLRIFGRLRSIRSIINALTASMIPVLNAFFIMAVVICLYSILGVSFFADSAPEDFGNLSRAIISMFRIAAGETWIEGKPILRDDGKVDWGTAAFIISYVVIINWTLLQVSLCYICACMKARRARARVLCCDSRLIPQHLYLCVPRCDSCKT